MGGAGPLFSGGEKWEDQALEGKDVPVAFTEFGVPSWLVANLLYDLEQRRFVSVAHAGVLSYINTTISCYKANTLG